jgi:hypothetical protein
MPQADIASWIPYPTPRQETLPLPQQKVNVHYFHWYPHEPRSSVLQARGYTNNSCWLPVDRALFLGYSCIYIACVN